MSASRVQAVKGPFSLYGIVQGQWAFNPLLASEQFTFGGSQLGRGYDVAELIGDKGLAGSLELRYDLAVGKVLQNLQLYAFYDAGMIWNFKFIGGTPRKLSGTTTGVGTRFYFTKFVSGNFMWTQTLTKQVAAEELIGDGLRPRTWFSVVASFA
jgi:hemolysin activation/secretion protein